jgi:hypothetical protein
MDPIVVPLLSRRLERALAVQKLNHAVPTVGLVAAGMQALKNGARGWDLALACVEIGTSVLLVVTIARGVRAARKTDARGKETHRPHHLHRIDWIDIWAAAVLFAEAAERWHLRHHIARPTILTALLTLGLGLSHGRITAFRRRRRSLRISAEGIYVGGRPFSAFSAPWRDIAAIVVDRRAGEIRTRSGRVRRLDLADLENADAVRAALEDAQAHIAAIGVREQTAAAPSPLVP